MLIHITVSGSDLITVVIQCLCAVSRCVEYAVSTLLYRNSHCMLAVQMNNYWSARDTNPDFVSERRYQNMWRF